MTVHILKLAVGADSVDDMIIWQRHQMAAARAMGLPPRPVCGTRSWPKRAAEVLAGGSLYWVIRGAILCRQRIVEIGPVTDEHGPRCGLYLDPDLIRTHPQPRRAFQGWRYLPTADAPADFQIGSPQGDLPDDLRRKLSELGAW